MNSHESLIDTRWGDLDLLGHVNNVAYMVYFENARVQLVHDINAVEHFGGLALVVVQANISYKVSATHPSKLKVVTTIPRIGNTSMTFHHVLQDRDGETIYSEADITAVWVSMEDNQPKPVPEFMRQWAQPESAAR